MISVLSFMMNRKKGKEDERNSVAGVVHNSIPDYNDNKETTGGCRK